MKALIDEYGFEIPKDGPKVVQLTGEQLSIVASMLSQTWFLPKWKGREIFVSETAVADNVTLEWKNSGQANPGFLILTEDDLFNPSTDDSTKIVLSKRSIVLANNATLKIEKKRATAGKAGIVIGFSVEEMHRNKNVLDYYTKLFEKGEVLQSDLERLEDHIKAQLLGVDTSRVGQLKSVSKLIQSVNSKSISLIGSFPDTGKSPLSERILNPDHIFPDYLIPILGHFDRKFNFAIRDILLSQLVSTHYKSLNLETISTATLLAKNIELPKIVVDAVVETLDERNVYFNDIAVVDSLARIVKIALESKKAYALLGERLPRNKLEAILLLRDGEFPIPGTSKYNDFAATLTATISKLPEPDQ